MVREPACARLPDARLTPDVAGSGESTRPIHT